jgi:hypothetical protein
MTDIIIFEFSAKKLAKVLEFLTQNTAKLCKKFIITLGFKKNCNFCGEIGKIAEISDHNIESLTPGRNIWILVLFSRTSKV